MDIGNLLSTFGTAGFFIWYLLNREKVTTEKIERKLDKLINSINDFSLLLLDALDVIIPSYGEGRNAQEIRERILDRKKNVSEV